jgi:assimilatory nitrate reductase catalytic subunit
MPDQATVRRALERAEFVVVQDAFAHTATGELADLLLPASTWGEKDGTVTNSERRISRVRPAVPAPGQARHDWQIAVDFARRLQTRGIGPRHALFPYDTPESIWNEHRESTRGRDLDITGLRYAMLEASPQQWPCPEGHASGQARLYADGVFPTPDGRARFANTAYREVAEPRESRYPFALTTGRLRDQWHGMSRTGTLGRLFGHVAEPAVQLNPQDMARRGLAEGDLVHITSKRGSIVVPLQASEDVAMGQAFMAMHWGPEYLGGLSSSGQPLAGVNALTTSAYCPDSKQPELKHAAVKILKAELPWTLLALAWLPADSALRTREALRALMARFPFASCVPFGRERTGVLLRAAAHEPPPEALLAEIETLLRLDDGSVLRYADVKRGQRRAVRLQRHPERSTVEAFLLAGDTRAEVWLKPLLQDELPAQAYGRALLQGSAQAPVAMAAPSRQVCTCFNVSESAIQTQLLRCRGSVGERLAQLQQALQCGTNCGSCVPELQRLVRATPLQKQAA